MEARVIGEEMMARQQAENERKGLYEKGKTCWIIIKILS